MNSFAQHLLHHMPVLQVIVPLLVAPLVLLLQERRLAWVAAASTSLLSLSIATFLAAATEHGGTMEYALGGWAAPFGIALVVDAFSALLLLIISGASTIALLIAHTSIDREIPADRQHLFYTAWLLALAGLCGIVVAGDAFNIFVFMEISSLATYILISGGPRREALSAVFRYLVMGTLGATFYLIGVGFVYMMTGTLNLADMMVRLEGVDNLNPVLVAAGFITVGLALKAAVFPLHGWLPNAYAFAPHAVTVFIAACSTKVALYVLFRFDFMIFQNALPDHGLWFAAMAIPLAIAAILVASVLAIREAGLKRLLAYSSIAQVGYMLLGATMLTTAGLTGGILHMFNHALAKGALFIAVACIAFHGGITRVDELAGIAKRMPLTMAAFVIAGLSLIGIPGTAGFTSKWQIAVAAMESGPGGMLIIAPIVVGSFMAVVYIWKIVEIAYFGKSSVTERNEAPTWMLVILWVAVAANIYFGLNPELPLNLAESAARQLMDTGNR